MAETWPDSIRAAPPLLSPAAGCPNAGEVGLARSAPGAVSVIWKLELIGIAPGTGDGSAGDDRSEMERPGPMEMWQM